MSIIGTELDDLDPATDRPAPADDTLTPLDVRLRTVLDAIPLATRREGLTLEALQARLKGRRKARCHPGELGAALVKLGYERKRDWRVGASYLARWYPPGYGPQGREMSHRVIRRLRYERPDLFPTYGERSKQDMREARRQAARELGLI
jgi:hypothetical protein